MLLKSAAPLALCAITTCSAMTTPLGVKAKERDRLKNVSFSTKVSIILMPCRDKSGNQLMVVSTENEFCTETFNQLIRDG